MNSVIKVGDRNFHEKFFQIISLITITQQGL